MESEVLCQRDAIVGSDRIATSATDRLIYSVDGFWLPQMWFERGGRVRRRARSWLIADDPVCAAHVTGHAVGDIEIRGLYELLVAQHVGGQT